MEKLYESIKNGVHNMIGVPAEQENLVFADRPLDDHRVLTNDNIQPGATLHLALGGKVSDEVGRGSDDGGHDGRTVAHPAGSVSDDSKVGVEVSINIIPRAPLNAFVK